MKYSVRLISFKQTGGDDAVFVDDDKSVKDKSVKDPLVKTVEKIVQDPPVTDKEETVEEETVEEETVEEETVQDPPVTVEEVEVVEEVVEETVDEKVQYIMDDPKNVHNLINSLIKELESKNKENDLLKKENKTLLEDIENRKCPECKKCRFF